MLAIGVVVVSVSVAIVVVFSASATVIALLLLHLLSLRVLFCYLTLLSLVVNLLSSITLVHFRQHRVH